MIADWSLVTPPNQEPLTLDEAKAQAQVYVSDDDALIDDFLRAAREMAELYLGRGLFTQTWRYVQDTWSDVMWLPMAAPLASVTSVQYYAADGTLTTLASSSYLVDTTTQPGRLVRAPNATWPALQSDRGAARVIVTYVVGWSMVASIPSSIVHAIRVTLTDFYRRRAVAEMPAAAVSLLAAHRVSWRPPQCAA